MKNMWMIAVIVILVLATFSVNKVCAWGPLNYYPQNPSFPGQLPYYNNNYWSYSWFDLNSARGGGSGGFGTAQGRAYTPIPYMHLYGYQAWSSAGYMGYYHNEGLYYTPYPGPTSQYQFK